MIKEICLENVEYLEKAIKKGVNRVELCDNLALGGTTVSKAIFDYANKICKFNKIELAPIIRLRGGDFVYKDYEKNIMISDAEYMVSQGVDRLVLGALDKESNIDYEFINKFILFMKKENPLINFTFHMAFDHSFLNLNYEDAHFKRLEAMKKLKDIGIDTILTHANFNANNILENIEIFKDYYKKADELDITVMAGGGLNFSNLDTFLEKCNTKVKAVHGTKIINLE